VLALKLFEATRDSSYFMWGVRIYDWTRINLQDPTDQLYFDNKSLTGENGYAEIHIQQRTNAGGSSNALQTDN
jgi:hypothetical protein